MRTLMSLPPSGRRQDGRVTAETLLQAAGEVFAELGPDRATSKEISARAGASAAAVNYYFGGIAALYDAVLLRAHERVMAWDRLAAISTSAAAPQEKIRQLIQIHVDAVVGLGPHAWELRLISRELRSPSPAVMRMHLQQMAPRMRLIDQIVAATVGLPIDDARVRQAAFFTMTPCVMLLTGPPMVLSDITGTSEPGPSELAQLTNHLTQYALGGLEALKGLWHEDPMVPPADRAGRGRRRSS